MTAFNTTGAMDGSAAMMTANDITTCNCTGACKLPGGVCPASIKNYEPGYYPTWMSPGPIVPPGHTTIGTCSLCRGPVTVPTVWAGIIPPTPTCARCGATKKPAYGPVLEMEKPTR